MQDLRANQIYLGDAAHKLERIPLRTDTEDHAGMPRYRLLSAFGPRKRDNVFSHSPGLYLSFPAMFDHFQSRLKRS
jgi:hypothetical protein